MDIKQITESEKGLKVGDKVNVFWGYGYGFRAAGQGEIVKIFANSVQVKLSSDVSDPHNPNKVGWPAGFILKGIPKFTMSNMARWNEWHRVVKV